VRQLRNVVESMVVVDYDGLLDLDDLPEELADRIEPAGESATQSLTSLVGKSLEDLQQLFIAETRRGRQDAGDRGTDDVPEDQGVRAVGTGDAGRGAGKRRHQREENPQRFVRRSGSDERTKLPRA